MAVILVLAALVFPVMGAAKRRADATDDIAKLHQIGLAATLYHEQNGSYPTTVSVLVDSNLITHHAAVSRADNYRLGMANEFIKGNPSATSKLTDYKRSYLGTSDIGIQPRAFNDQIQGQQSAGWLIDILSLERPQGVGLAAMEGKYLRLLLDTSVQTKSLRKIEGKASNGARKVSVSTFMLFCDPDPKTEEEWLKPLR